MAVAPYIVLASSTESIKKRFKAIQKKEPLTRTDGVSTLADGSIDKSNGPIIKSWSYMLRIPFESNDSDYGVYSDLVALFSLNDPFGSPNDVISLTDHFGNEFDCYFVGNLDPDNMTTILDGYNSAYIVNISLREKNT